MASSKLIFGWLGIGLVVGDHQSGEVFDLSVAASNDMIRHVDQFTTIELKYKSLASSSSG